MRNAATLLLHVANSKHVAKSKHVANSPDAEKIMEEEEETEAYDAETGSEAGVDEKRNSNKSTAETWTGPRPKRMKRISIERDFYG